MSLAKQLALASLGGILYFTGFVGFGFWPNIFVLFVPALVAIEGASPKRTLLIGTVFGLVTNCGGYYWVVHLIEEFAHLALPLAVLGYLLLCLYQGFLLAIVLWLVGQATRKLGLRPVWSLPVAFMALEQFYPLLFPSYVGNSFYTVTWLTQIVDITGMLGLTGLACLVNGALYELLCAWREKRGPNRLALAVPALAMGMALLYGAVQTSVWKDKIDAAPTLRVGMVQTNLGARDKAAKRDEFIARHQSMTKELLVSEPDLDLVVWPESAYNRYINRKTPSLGKTVTRGIKVPLIFGALTFDRSDASAKPKVYNTAVYTSSTGAVLQMFDKVELLMFGETLPFADTFPQIGRAFGMRSTFQRGKTFEHFEVPYSQGTASLLPMICYEDIIPTFVRRMWSEGGPASALVNVTNDSWYGDTHEPLIHLVLASFRSIETRRALIRSTNTGLSAFVDPLGRITSRTEQWQRQTLVADVPLIHDGQSTVYMMLGDVLAWLSLLLLIAGALRIRRVS